MKLTQNAPQLMTLGQLATEIGVPTWRLGYALKAAAIAPRQRVGILRVWGADQLPEIREAVKRTAGTPRPKQTA